VADEPIHGQTQIAGPAAAQDEALEKNRVRLLELIDDIPPDSDKRSDTALMRAQELIAAASFTAADLSKMLALQPRLREGCSTVLADLAAIWRVQAQLVSDIGSVFDKTGKLSEDSIVSCLFRHAASQFAREAVTSFGERLLGHCHSQPRQSLGTEIVNRAEAPKRSNLLAMIGALAVAAYAYYDTDRIGQQAIEFFTKEFELT
jgi:hypothetical protein